MLKACVRVHVRVHACVRMRTCVYVCVSMCVCVLSQDMDGGGALQ